MNRILVLKLMDASFGRFLTTVMPAPRRVARGGCRRFLIIRPGGIGDAVLLVPVIQALMAHFPDATVDVLAERRNAGVFTLSKDVRHILCYDRPRDFLAVARGRYDAVIDTEQWHRLSALVTRLIHSSVKIGYATNERKGLFTCPVSYSHDAYEVDSFFKLLEPLGIPKPLEAKIPFMGIPYRNRENAACLLGDFLRRLFVVVFPGGSIPERRWGAEKFRAVAEALFREGIPVVVVGGKEDAEGGEMIVRGELGLNLAGRTSLVETAAVIDRSAVLLSGDSGILHIGVGLGKSTVSLFGPGIAEKWAPRGEDHVVLNKNLSCSPCTCFGYTPKCPSGAKCMQEISVEEVTEAVLKLLRRNEKEISSQCL